MRALQEPEKTDFKFFEVLLVTELVCTYDKLNIYAKKKKNNSCHRHFKVKLILFQCFHFKSFVRGNLKMASVSTNFNENLKEP